MQEQESKQPKQKIPGDVSTLAASKRLSRYKPESAKPVRESDLKGYDEKKVGKLLEIYQKIRYTQDLDVTEKVAHSIMLVAVRNINCTENEVAAFCSRLANYIKREDDAFKPGLFLSALINTSSGKRFVINVQDMIPMAMLGYKNIKKITIIGDVGDGLGYKMQKGRIHVLGNVADYVGNTMTGGRIIIEGNAGDTGLCMQGGEIHVNGEIGEVDDIHMTGGRIIHKGKVITGGDE